MERNLGKNIEKIFSAFRKIDNYPKAIIKYGAIAFLLLFAAGTGLVVFNHTRLGVDAYLEFVANSVIKNSFTVLAEVVIGGLLFDYIFKK